MAKKYKDAAPRHHPTGEVTCPEVALNTRTLNVTHQCKLERQPLKVCVLSDGTVYARDWKTGDMLKGQLKRKWLF